MTPPRAAATAAPAPPVAPLTWAQVAAWRCGRHFLDRRAPAAAVGKVVSAVCGLHAQLLSSAELALWARVDGMERGVVARALWEERALVKTWAMRGTLHLLPAGELPMWQAGFATYGRHRQGSWLRYFGVTPDDVDRLFAAIAEALDGRTLTREELAVEVGRLTGSPDLGDKLRESWGSLLKPAAFEGLLCFAPGTGQSVRFTRPDQWLDGWEPADPAAALPEITRRYFAAHGPATREDFARWWGVSPAAAGRLVKALGAELAAVDVDGSPAWMWSVDATGAQGAEPLADDVVRLLPAFDHYVVAASGHAAALLPGDLRDRVYRPQGWLSPVVLVGGRMEGVWSQKVKGGRLAVHVEPFGGPSAKTRRAVGEEAERLAAFAGVGLDLTWG